MSLRRSKIVQRVQPRVLVDLPMGPVLRAIAKLAHEWGWHLLHLSYTGGEIPPDQRPQGAFVSCLPTDPLARQLRRMRCPVVRLGHLPHPEDDRVPSVMFDLAAQGRLAAEHLAERQFRQVGFVGSSPRDPDSDWHALFAAFEARAAELGMACHLYETASDHVPGEKLLPRFERRAKAVGNWLESLPKPVAVFTYSDHVAGQLCTMCARAGLRVPDEVAVLGMGNDETLCELSLVALSSLDPDRAERGRRAADLLRRLMSGEAGPKAPVMVPPAGIVTRRSTDVMAVPDRTVARALRFIWDHFDQDLSIHDISEAIGVKRRSLERGFQKHLGCSVHTELARKRVAELRRLLLATDDALADLAPRAGFTTLANAHKSFRRAYGLSPGKYRREKAELRKECRIPNAEGRMGSPRACLAGEGS